MAGKAQLYTLPKALSRLYFLPHLPPRLPRIVDRPLVFDGGDIAGIPVEDNGFEHATHDFSAARFRQHGHEVQLADDGHRTKLPADGFEERLSQIIRGRMPVLEEHER